MKTKQLKWGFFGLMLAMGTWAMTSCETGSTVSTAKLGKPSLQSFDFKTVNTPYGKLNIADLMLSKSFKAATFNGGFGFPGGTVDEDMKSAATAYSNAGAQLGRVLFYDKRMSLNNTVACGSCHHQELAFSDMASLSAGFGGRKTHRNSIAITNPVVFSNLFWDSRANSPMDLSLRPVFDHIEMGMESDEMLETKLAATDFYPALFQAAFGSTEVTRKKVSLAITQFLSSMITKNSRFDVAVARELTSRGMNNGGFNNFNTHFDFDIAAAQFSNFNALEQMGKDLFFSDRARCSRCHTGENLSAPEDPGSGYSGPTIAGTANIGLDRTYADNGKNNGKFRIPSLRNVEITGPYMHDGRFANLDQVIDHYNRGIQPHPHLDKNLMVTGGSAPVRLNLTQEEKDALVAFLRTLTDVSFITDKKFSDPFAN
jgi:cytochrome c peroxidase